MEIETALKEGRAVDNRWHICKDGTTFYAYGLVFPLTGRDGELLGYVKILRDLTERRKSEEAIKKYVKQMLELLYKATTDELNMLDYLVEWARIKYASEIFTPAKIELVKCVNKVFDTLNEVAAVNAIILHSELDENTNVFADEKMVLSVLQNIVSNAIKHSNKGGTITATARRKDDKIIVQIKDTGIGMSKEIQEKLFTPQMNALSNIRKENKGAGIGLLLVKGFLEKNGGEIWVESVEGEGSSFYFTLPEKEPLDKIFSAGKVEFDESA